MIHRLRLSSSRALNRFTRDRVSRFVWGGLTMALVVLLVVAFEGSGRARSDARDQAQARAQTWAQTVLFDNLSSSLVEQPILGANYRDLLIAVQSQIMVDERVMTLRIWQPDGTLIFSTDGRDQAGEKTSSPQVLSSGSPTGKTVSILTSSSPKLFETFVPLRVPDRISIVGSVEIDQSLTRIYAGARSGWSPLEPWLFLALVVCAAMTFLSLRTPVGTLGAGVTSAVPQTEPSADGTESEEEAEPDLVAQRAELAEDLARRSQDSLHEALERLRAAEESYRWLDAKLKRTQAALSGDADARERELQAMLASSDMLAPLTPEAVPAIDLESRVRQLEDELHGAVARAHEADARAQEAERAILGASNEVATHRRAADVARTQAEAYRRAAQEARTQAELANARADDAERHPGQLGEIDQDLLRSLEARIVAAESRAGLAERRLEELRSSRGGGSAKGDQLDDGSDLRARLARTAARKKLTHEQVDQAASSRDEPDSSDADP